MGDLARFQGSRVGDQRLGAPGRPADAPRSASTAIPGWVSQYASIWTQARSIPPRPYAALLFAGRIAYCNFDHNEAEAAGIPLQSMVAPA